MNHDDLVEEWAKDNTIDQTNIINELTRTPFLHAKYMKLYIGYKARHVGAEAKYHELRNVKRKYYQGKMSKEELDEYGWDQYQGLKMSSTEFMMVCEDDPDLIKLDGKVKFYQLMVQGLDYILKSINSRDWALKTMVEHNKFLSGV